MSQGNSAPGPPSTSAERLAEKLNDGTATVAVIGLGYVGLPIALAFAEAGFQVLGIDANQDKIDQLRRGRSYIRHLDESRLQRCLDPSKLTVTTSFDELTRADALLICVPTPLTPQRDPDLSYVEATSREIAARLRPGQLVVLESTTYPGTTDELIRPLLEDEGQVIGQDVFLAFSPEREDPGNPDHTATRIPKVIGGVDPMSAELARSLYHHIVPKTVVVSSARTAEATKLTENIFRAVNIALVNELKLVFDAMGIDIWEVLDAAETKPFGFMRFNPGPGWGGHCIPLDPFYLAWKAREHGGTARFIELAGEVNQRTQSFVIEKVLLALNEVGKSVRGSRILVLGLAYKKNVDDARESPAFDLIRRLTRLGAEIHFHDPQIQTAPPSYGLPEDRNQSVNLDASILTRSDAVLLVTDHSDVDYDLVQQNAPLIIDTRGVFRGDRATDKVVRA